MHENYLFTRLLTFNADGSLVHSREFTAMLTIRPFASLVCSPTFTQPLT